MSSANPAAMPKIMELVLAKWDAMKHASNDAQAMAVANENAALAAQAIKGGYTSPAWRDYMLQFVATDPKNPKEPLNPAHLARLLGAD